MKPAKKNCVKKNPSLQKWILKKSISYKMKILWFCTVCMKNFFDLSKIQPSDFFYGDFFSLLSSKSCIKWQNFEKKQINIVKILLQSLHILILYILSKFELSNFSCWKNIQFSQLKFLIFGHFLTKNVQNFLKF